MKKAIFGVLILLVFIACQQNNSNTKAAGETPAVTNQKKRIPQDRSNPNPKPVAIFSENVTGEMGNLNHWKFEVALYETPKTFTYRIQIKYAELNVTDTLQLPDFDIAPKPALQKGKDEYSCIIGFMDDKNIFRDYKLVKVTDGNLHITTLKYYSVQRTSAQ